MRGGKLDQALKDGVMADTGLPGRYYNGITKTLEGKIDAVRELRKLDIANSEERVRRIAKKVKQLEDDHAKWCRRRSIVGSGGSRSADMWPSTQAPNAARRRPASCSRVGVISFDHVS
jgi:hypothetical protein